jgi:hypothetical protein
MLFVEVTEGGDDFSTEDSYIYKDLFGFHTSLSSGIVKLISQNWFKPFSSFSCKKSHSVHNATVVSREVFVVDVEVGFNLGEECLSISLNPVKSLWLGNLVCRSLPFIYAVAKVNDLLLKVSYHFHHLFL